MKWETFGFANPPVLFLLLLLPLLAAIAAGRGAAPAVIYSSLGAMRGLGKPRRAKAGGIRVGLPLLSFVVLVLALARPQQGRTLTHVEASGIDIMLALDVSRSMLAEDFTIGNRRANRLEAVKQVTEKFIEARPNDRMGIVAFAGKPYLVSPLTLDHDWLLQNLERLRIGLVEDGTAIGSAIASSSNRLRDRDSKSRIVVLLTDGDNNAGQISPATAAEAAKALGIKVYAIGAGTRGFAPIPVQDPFSGGIAYRNVKVEVNEETLREVAKITDAQFYRATDSKSLEQIFEEIDKLEKSTVEMSEYKEVRELFPWFVAVGASLLGLHILLTQTAWRRLP
jgi:Ca-activated chloride channel family protein